MVTNVVDACGVTGGAVSSCNVWASVGVFVAGCLVGYMVGRLSKRAGKNEHTELYDKILREILVCQQIPQEEIAVVMPVVKAEIMANSRFTDARMRSISRIECVYAKAGGADYEVEVLAYKTSEANVPAKMVRIKLAFDWAYLPSEVRNRFILDRSERVVMLMYERKEQGNA